MQQATEITSVAVSPHRPVLGSISIMLLCSMIAFAITCAAGCTGKDQNKNELNPGRVQSDKSNAPRMLRRGLTGEPRTLDPQLADDEFSFPVLRDLYEGLTAEDRNGQIVPGVAESWTVDSTGTIYTFLLRPDAKWSNGDRTIAMEFVEGLRRAVDPKTASGSSAVVGGYKSAQATSLLAGKG